MEHDKLILKFKWKSKGPRKSMTLEEEEQGVLAGRRWDWDGRGTRKESPCPTRYQTFYTAIVMKKECYLCQNRQVNPTY